jgi:GAF domain-containing protein
VVPSATLHDTDDDVITGTLRLALEMLGMDAAHVSDFTDGHQRFRHVEGANEAFGLHAGDRMPLEETYCVRMADGRLPNVVADTSKEPQVAELAATRDANLGAYVGVPIVASDGEVLGSFCCLSHEPDPGLAERDITFLHVLAKLVADRIERQRLEAQTRERLEEQVAARTAELSAAVDSLAQAQAETAKRLSMAIEYRDDQTGAHIERVGRMSAALAKSAGLDEAFCDVIAQAAPLHDVGKVAAPDAVLLKHGTLDPDERAVIERHAETGYRMLEGSSSEVLKMAATIALTHHERVDGTGYNRRLEGEEIPVEGRIVAIVDVFDALTSDRVYRRALPVDEALGAMRRDEGHFDPELLEIFVREVVPALPGLLR